MREQGTATRGNIQTPIVLWPHVLHNWIIRRFEALKVSAAFIDSMSLDQRDELVDLISRFGGKFQPDLEYGSTTHLIAEVSKSYSIILLYVLMVLELGRNEVRGGVSVGCIGDSP